MEKGRVGGSVRARGTASRCWRARSWQAGLLLLSAHALWLAASLTRCVMDSPVEGKSTSICMYRSHLGSVATYGTGLRRKTTSGSDSSTGTPACSSSCAKRHLYALRSPYTGSP